jgi:hypothetical protein
MKPVGQLAAGVTPGGGGGGGGPGGGGAGGGDGWNEPSPGEATPSAPLPHAAKLVAARAASRVARTTFCLEVIPVSLDHQNLEGERLYFYATPTIPGVWVGIGDDACPTVS